MKKPKPRKETDWHLDARKRVEELRAHLLAQLDAFEARLLEAMAQAGERRRLHLARMDAYDRRAEEALDRAKARASGIPKPRPKKPRKDEGGEPVPAVPRPKPTPLSGGAAAPIERRARIKPASAVSRAKTRNRIPTDARLGQNL